MVCLLYLFIYFLKISAVCIIDSGLKEARENAQNHLRRFFQNKVECDSGFDKGAEKMRDAEEYVEN